MGTPDRAPTQAPQDQTLGYDHISQRKTKEILFAFVEPIGGGARQAVTILKDILRSEEYGYEINEIEISLLLSQEAIARNIAPPKLPEQFAAIRKPSVRANAVYKQQQWGNTLRKIKGNDFLARKAIQNIAKFRMDRGGIEKAATGVPVPKPMKFAHIIRSIKHTEELDLLKSVYGNLLFLIATSGKYEQQLNNFRSEPMTKEDQDQRELEYNILADIDQNEGIDHGQQVRKIFYRADLFLNNDKSLIEQQIRTFLELLFGKVVKSPTTEENLMFNAFAASLRSTCLSRQVGAAIADNENELLSIGWNDVPAYGGGLATDHDKSCKALCRKKGMCRSTVEINELIANIHQTLVTQKFIQKSKDLSLLAKALKSAGIAELIEFSRAIHAEMEAILSAARAAKPGLRDGTIYVTTYPCENCVKHILASGLKRVVYIEPYPKSRAKAFFADFIQDERTPEEHQNKLQFSQFIGIAPLAYSLLYRKWFERKDDFGNYITNEGDLTPVTSVYLDSYTLYEGRIADEVSRDK